jgi:CDP-diacylglycerol--glycerol-3-phosphate 3-phosphatidyltransferase
MVRVLPNIISCFRLFGTVALLFTDPLSTYFYVIYTLCGVSDVLDGTIARATGNTTELGAKLDSIADILFYAVMLFKILPLLIKALPGWIWYVVVSVIAVRIMAYIVAALKYRRFASLHTYLNKLTGALIFTVPYFFYGDGSFVFAISMTVCVVAAIASLEELAIHFFARDYDPNRKQFGKVTNKRA